MTYFLEALHTYMFKDDAKLDFLNNAVDSVVSSIVSDNQFFTYSIQIIIRLPHLP